MMCGIDASKAQWSGRIWCRNNPVCCKTVVMLKRGNSKEGHISLMAPTFTTNPLSWSRHIVDTKLSKKYCLFFSLFQTHKKLQLSAESSKHFLHFGIFHEKSKQFSLNWFASEKINFLETKRLISIIYRNFKIFLRGHHHYYFQKSQLFQTDSFVKHFFTAFWG